MKVFISWSGSNSISHRIATILRGWIPRVLQRTECFLSSQDIGAGTIANNELFSHLEKSRLGIVCLTRANARGPWINFEAGAIAKMVGEARVCPLLIDISPGDVRGPLSAFQMKELSRSGVKDIIAMINDASDNPLAERDWIDSFDTRWPAVEKDFEKKGSESAAFLHQSSPISAIPRQMDFEGVRNAIAKMHVSVESEALPLLHALHGCAELQGLTDSDFYARAILNIASCYLHDD